MWMSSSTIEEEVFREFHPEHAYNSSEVPFLIHSGKAYTTTPWATKIVKKPMTILCRRKSVKLVESKSIIEKPVEVLRSTGFERDNQNWIFLFLLIPAFILHFSIFWLVVDWPGYLNARWIEECFQFYYKRCHVYLAVALSSDSIFQITHVKAFLRLKRIKLKTFLMMTLTVLFKKRIFNHFSRFPKILEAFSITLLLFQVTIFKKFTPVGFQKQQE